MGLGGAARHAVHARRSSPNVFDAAGARQGHRHLGRRGRPGASRSARSLGGFAARALLVGLGLPDQRADRRRRRWSRSCCLVPESREPQPGPARPARRPALHRRPGAAGLRHHRTAATPASAAPDRAASRSVLGVVLLVAFVWHGDAQRPPVAGHVAVPRPAFSGRCRAICLVFFAAIGIVLLPRVLPAAGARLHRRCRGGLPRPAGRRRRRSSSPRGAPSSSSAFGVRAVMTGGLALVAVVMLLSRWRSTRPPRSG